MEHIKLLKQPKWIAVIFVLSLFFLGAIAGNTTPPKIIDREGIPIPKAVIESHISPVQLTEQSEIPSPVQDTTQVHTAVYTGSTFANNYEAGSCTWFVASQVSVPNTLGNANTWGVYASQMGYTVSSIPKVGSVAQTSAGAYGHVAIVVAVSGDQVQLSEMNVYGAFVQDYRWVSMGSYVYIYV